MFQSTSGIIESPEYDGISLRAQLGASLTAGALRIVNYQPDWYIRENPKGAPVLCPCSAYAWFLQVMMTDEIVEGFNTTDYGLRRNSLMDRLHILNRGTYLLGMMEAGEEIFEFAPGRIIIHRRLPAHFQTSVYFPAVDLRLHNQQYVRSIYNPPTSNNWTLCFDRVNNNEKVWVHDERNTTGTQTSWIPATNGIALRRIYPPVNNWWNMLLQGDMTPQERYGINQLRSGYRSYEETHPRILELYAELQSFPDNWEPRNVWPDRFFNLVRRKLLLAVKEVRSGERSDP